MSDDVAATQVLPVAGAELAFRDTGNGPPVVLVHGSASDIRTWHETAEALKDDYRVISYSRRYATPNAPIPHEADDPLPVHADDLVAVIENQVGAPAHLVGHSLGGFIALLVALRRPDLVRSLTLMELPVIPLYLDIPPSLPGILKLFLRAPGAGVTILRFAATTMAPVTKAFERGDDEAAMRTYGRGVLGPERYAALTPERRDIIWENRAPDRAQLLGAGWPSLDESEIRGLSGSVLLVRGAESPPVFHLLVRRLSRLIPQARVETIPGASHILQEDAPGAFATTLRDFLAGH